MFGWLKDEEQHFSSGTNFFRYSVYFIFSELWVQFQHGQTKDTSSMECISMLLNIKDAILFWGYVTCWTRPEMSIVYYRTSWSFGAFQHARRKTWWSLIDYHDLSIELSLVSSSVVRMSQGWICLILTISNSIFSRKRRRAAYDYIKKKGVRALTQHTRNQNNDI